MSYTLEYAVPGFILHGFNGFLWLKMQEGAAFHAACSSLSVCSQSSWKSAQFCLRRTLAEFHTKLEDLVLADSRLNAAWGPSAIRSFIGRNLNRATHLGRGKGVQNRFVQLVCFWLKLSGWTFRLISSVGQRASAESPRRVQHPFPNTT